MTACKAPTVTKVSPFCPKIQPRPLCSVRKRIAGTRESWTATPRPPSSSSPPKGRSLSLFYGYSRSRQWGLISAGWKEGEQSGECDVRISPDLVIPTAGSILPGPARAGSGVPAEHRGCRTAPPLPLFPMEIPGLRRGLRSPALSGLRWGVFVLQLSKTTGWWFGLCWLFFFFFFFL